MTWDERGTYRHSPAEQAERDAQRRAQTARWAPIVCLHERKQIVKSHRDGTEYTCPDCGLDFYVYEDQR